MITRPNAPVYEDALIHFIADKNVNEAIKTIGYIQDYVGPNKPSLTYVDVNGMDYIHFALHARLPRVAQALLDTGTFDDNEAILSGTNSQGQTLICAAAELGYTGVVECLLERTFAFLNAPPQDQRQDSPAYQIWLKADNKNNTPLHYAAASKKPALYTCLIDLVSAADELINARNNDRETPLHLALKQGGEPNLDLITKLLNTGADFGLLSLSRMSPFGYLCRCTIEQQVNFINQLDDHIKQGMLGYYKHYLSTHSKDKKIKQVYLSLINQQSLPPSNIPLLSTHGIFRFRDPANGFNTSLLAQDKRTLDTIISDLEATLDDWTTRTPVQKYKITSVAVPTLAWLAWGGSLAYLIYKTNDESNNPVAFTYRNQPIIGPNYPGPHPNTTHFECHREDDEWVVYQHSYGKMNPYPNGTLRFYSLDCANTNHDLNLLLSFFTAVGGCIGSSILSLCLPKRLWNKEVTLTISATEQEAILRMLADHIVSKLIKLRDNDLPTSPETILKLRREIDKPAEDLLQQDATDWLNALLTLVKQVRTDLDVLKKPLSTIPHQLVPSLEDNTSSGQELRAVVVEADDSSDVENRPLLGRD